MADTFEGLVERLWPGAVLLECRSLEGGVSARVTVLAIQQPDGQTERVVVREYSQETTARDPCAPESEFRLLQVLYTEGIPVPRPIHLGKPGDLGPSSLLVVGHIEGAVKVVNLGPAKLEQLARMLVRILALEASRPDLAFLPELDDRMAASLAGPWSAGGSLKEEAIRDAIMARPHGPANSRVLLHGDFWPGNTIWVDGRLVGIIDWEDSAAGDPLVDLANARLEILWAAGIEAMTRLTDSFRELAPMLDWTDLPIWDLWAAWCGARLGDWGLAPDIERAWRTCHSWFVGEALSQLGR